MKRIKIELAINLLEYEINPLKERCRTANCSSPTAKTKYRTPSVFSQTKYRFLKRRSTHKDESNRSFNLTPSTKRSSIERYRLRAGKRVLHHKSNKEQIQRALTLGQFRSLQHVDRSSKSFGDGPKGGDVEICVGSSCCIVR
mgnify:CR=1 FL=1